MLPRLPLIEDVKDFRKFSDSGRQLSELHLNYENQTSIPELKVTGVDSGFYSASIFGGTS